MTVAASRYLLRPMTIADIARVSEIERQSFPTMWPQTAYKRELQRNSLAAYLVVCERAAPRNVDEQCPDGASERPVAGASHPAESSAGGGLARALQRLFGSRAPVKTFPTAEPDERILGFVGMWFMVDEAHIVTIAVAESSRRRGLGEMLLTAAIELAQRREQEVVTLECRVSNTGAQALYEKYGFHRVGVRKRYYTDNGEDALIMTTFPIREVEFQTRFQQLRAAHAARWGTPSIDLPQG